MTICQEENQIIRPLLYLAGGLVLGETMALWMTVKQEFLGLAVMLLVLSCVFVHKVARGRGREKGRRPVFFVRKQKQTNWFVQTAVKAFRKFLACWRKPILGTVTIGAVIVAAAGLLIGVWRMEREQAVIRKEEGLVEACLGTTVYLEGQIWEIRATDYGNKLILKDCVLWTDRNGTSDEENMKMTEVRNVLDQFEDSDKKDLMSRGAIRAVYAYVNADSRLKIGMRIRVSGGLKLPEPDRNPGQFNYRLYCHAKGICGTMNGKSVEILDSDYLVLQEGLRRIGLMLEQRLELIADEDDVGILKAVLLGEKGDMDDEVYRLYQKNGISHVLAISGLHVSVIGMGLWNSLRKLGVGYWGAGAAAFGMLFCFGSIAGFGPSVVRAVFMMGISFIAGAFGRTYDLPSAMSVPAMGLLLFRPYVITQASFQLSFLAVFAIFFPGAYLAKAWRLTGFWQNLWTSVSIQLVTFPAVLYHSFEFPIYGIVLNLVVVPLMTYVLISGILGLAGSFVWLSLGTFLLGGAHMILALYRFVCELVGHAAGAYWIIGRPSLPAIAVYFICLLIGVWICATRRIGAVLWMAGILCLGPMAPCGLEITFLDVGQGDGIVLRNGSHAIVVDCGSSQEQTAGEDVLIPFLKSQGIDRLDAAIVSHGDQDHINGIRVLLEQEACGIEIGQLLMPVTGMEDEACLELEKLAVERGIPVVYVKTGVVLGTTNRKVLGGPGWNMIGAPKTQGVGREEEAIGLLGNDVMLRCLHPQSPDGGSDRNDGSLVLQLEYGEFCMLLTGDVEVHGERQMAETGLLEDVTVLKAAHHGSASSTNPDFLERTMPEYVVFSYGAGNRYGHPAKEVVERCVGNGAVICETAKCGAIRIRTDGKKIQIRGWVDRKDGI